MDNNMNGISGDDLIGIVTVQLICGSDFSREKIASEGDTYSVIPA